MRRRLAPGAAIAALVAIAVAGCAADEDPLPFALWCEGSDRETSMVLLAAQAVPETPYLVCVEALPDGWTAETSNVDDTGTEVTFDSDRSGPSAFRLQFRSDCGYEGAELVDEDDGVDTYRRVESRSPRYRAVDYRVFDGGCVELEFDIGTDEAVDRFHLLDAIRLEPVPEGGFTRDIVY